MYRKIVLIGIAYLISAFVSCSSIEKPKAMLIPQDKKSIETGASTTRKEAWQGEWNKTVELANKEGRVVIYGSAGDAVRNALIAEFKKAYPGILLEYTSMTGSQLAPRVVAERNAGVYLIDLNIGTITQTLTVLKPKGYLVPIEPLLILPEVKDRNNWSEGKLWWGDDEEKNVLVFGLRVAHTLVYSSALVDPGKVQGMSYWDLIKPEWKGKIVWEDPRGSGSGRGTAWFAYVHPQIGKDWFWAMARNDVALTRDRRQVLEWVARGKYLLAIGGQTGEAQVFRDTGIPLNIQYLMKEGSSIRPGSSVLSVLDKAPHPNATKVFLNWLLTKEGQSVWSKSGDYPSLRLDVPRDHLDQESIMKPGVEYLRGWGEKASRQLNEVGEFSMEVFGR